MSIVESSDQSRVSVLVNQMDQTFTKGENYTVKVFAANSFGTSDPWATQLQVSCDSSISCVYCNQLLTSANPGDPTDVIVLIDPPPCQPGYKERQFPLHHGTAGRHRVPPQHHSVQHLWNSAVQHYSQTSTW